MGRGKRRQEPEFPHPPPLEDLLEAEEAALYGQVCWSIANHGTDMPTVGEVITLEGGYGGEDHSSRKFRITDESMVNVERCLGMKTCGEAVALFSDGKVEDAEPAGDCPHGHPEAAIEFMFHGIRPTEPCPDCGEIPKFGNTLMSPGLHPDSPVKAVDGREYSTCPDCGGGVLQLEGSSIAEWGWKIVCLNCGWGMKLAESLDMAQYCDLMEEVKSRVESVNRLMEMPGLTIRPRVESVCLQLRMILEFIVFSSLVSNKDVWRRSQKELQSSRDLGKKLNELRRIHPNFYPQPVDLVGGGTGREPVDRAEGFLTEDRLTEVYGRLGNILHAENPMGKETDYGFFIDAVPGWLTEIMNLLECHKVFLYHRPQEFYLIKMFGDADGDLMSIRFRTTAEGETKCAWPDCVSWSVRRYCEYLQRPWRQCLLPELEPAQSEGKRAADEIDGAAARSWIPTVIHRMGGTVAKARIDLEQIKEDWLVGNSAVAFVGALLMAQAWEPSNVNYVLPIVGVKAPAFPQAAVLGFVTGLAVSSLALALASAIPPIRSWAIEKATPYSVVLEILMSVAFLLSLVASLAEIPSDQGWAKALWWGGVALLIFFWARILFRSWAIPTKWLRQTSAGLVMKARNRFAGLSREPNDADTSGGE